MSPEPETVESIEQQGLRDPGGRIYRCGCEHRSTRWYLCPYHDGFDDGIFARTPENVEEPT